MAFKSIRLLNEAISKELESLRKKIMGSVTDWSDDVSAVETFESLDALRKLFDELAAKADRPTIEDVTKLSPGDYVATMKPLVGLYHRQLMMIDKLAPCLCEDLQADAVILMLVGEGKTVVRTAHNPTKPEVQLAVETIIASLDQGIQQIATEGVEAAEEALKLDQSPVSSDDDDDVKRCPECGGSSQTGYTCPTCGGAQVINSECKVALGLMEPDPRSGGCDQPTCMRCYPEPGDPPLPEVKS